MQISAFKYTYLKAIANTICEDGINYNLVLIQGIKAYYNQKDFEKAIASLKDIRTYASYLADKHTIYTD